MQCYNAKGDPKIQYKSKKHAERIRRQLPYANAVKTYHCAVCGCWHHGRRTPYKKLDRIFKEIRS